MFIMRKQILLLLLLFFFSLANAQNSQWLLGIGGPDVDHLAAMVTDSSGNLYMTGFFSNTVDFDPGPGVFNVTTKGENDIFVTKLNADGIHQWTRTFGSVTNDSGRDLILDYSGHLVIRGEYTGTVDFNPGPAIYNLSGGYNFILKLDTSGNFIRVFENSISGSSMACDKANNIYISSSLGNTIDVDPGPATILMTSNGLKDAMVQKFDSTGAFKWAIRVGGPGQDYGAKVLYNTFSNTIYLTGAFSQTVDFDPGNSVYQMTSAGDQDMFIMACSAQGVFKWAKRIGSTSTDIAYGGVTDKASNLYSLSKFELNVDFDPGPDSTILKRSQSSGIAIFKLDSQGTFQWAKKMLYRVDARDIAIGIQNDLLVTGSFSGTVDIDVDTGVSRLSSAGDGFVFRLSEEGTYLSARQLGRQGGQSPTMIDVLPSGYLTLGGSFSLKCSFDFGNGIQTITGNNNTEIFMLRYNPGFMLPVEFTSFLLSKTESDVLLKWQTASEKNALLFELERSTDGLNFSMIAKIPASGNSSVPVNYTYTDRNAASGKNVLYYRLKQLDINGTFSYSEVRLLNAETLTDENHLIYPNPVSDILSISLSNFTDVLYTITDAAGQIILKGLLTSQQTALDLSEIKPGIYFLRTGSRVHKIIRK